MLMEKIESLGNLIAEELAKGTATDGVPAEAVRRALLSEGRAGGVYGEGEVGQDVRHVDDDGGSVGSRGAGIPPNDVRAVASAVDRY